MLKKVIYILIVLVALNSITYSYEQFGEVEQNIYGYSFNKNSTSNFLKKANYNLSLWNKARDTKLKQKYLQEAMRYYYLASKSDNTNIYAHIGLGKVYDEMNQDRYAKEHFCFAYNINNKNPDLNYKFGDFYYKRRDLYKAQYYFNRAYNYGYKNSYTLNLKMAQMYEKLADTQKTQYHYSKAISHINNDLYRASKIRLLDEPNSSNSQYYLFIK